MPASFALAGAVGNGSIPTCKSFAFFPRHTKLGNGFLCSYSARVNALTNTLIEEIKAAPDAVQREVLDFVVFLKAQEAAREEGRENLLALAQSAWGADWDSPGEDEAWRDL
jgi:hypothetical protein